MRPSTTQHLWIVAGLLLVTAAVFAPSLDNGFVNWDDPNYVTENPLVRDLSPSGIGRIFTSFVSGNYHPLTVLSLAVDHRIDGVDPGIYHLHSLILHLVNIILVYLLILRLTGRKLPAAFTAMVFAAHPMHAEPVAWVSSRKDLLFAFFYLLGLIVYIKRYAYGAATAVSSGRSQVSGLKSRFHYSQLTAHGSGLIPVGLLFLLALLAKPQAASFPFALLAVDGFFRRPFTRRLFLEKLPLFALALGAGIVAWFGQQDLGSIPGAAEFRHGPLDQLWFLPCAFWQYVQKFFLPLNLSAVYPYPEKTGGLFPWPVLISPVLCVAAIAAGAWIARRDRLAGFGLLFFGTLIVFNLKFIPVGEFFMADRYTYLPYIGLALAASSLVANVHPRGGRWLMIAVITIWLVALIPLSRERVRVWKNGLTLWSDVVRKFPEDPFGRFGLSQAHEAAGDGTAAMREINRVLELDPDFIEAINTRGIYRQNRGRLKEALEDFDRALARDPGNVAALNNRGNTLLRLGRLEDARRDLEAAQELDPDSPENLASLGTLYETAGDVRKAVVAYGESLALRPDAAVYARRAGARLRLKEHAGAVTDFTRAIELEPDDPRHYGNRGAVHAMEGSYQRAAEDFDRALALDPAYAPALLNRSRALAELGRRDEAYRDAVRARELGARVSEAYLRRLQSPPPSLPQDRK